jgi:hypothetical protein
MATASLDQSHSGSLWTNSAEASSTLVWTLPHWGPNGQADEGVSPIGAARVVLSGEATGEPNATTGEVEAIPLLQVPRRSAMKARTQVASQLHAVIDTAPEQLRSVFAGMASPKIVTKASNKTLIRLWLPAS